MRTAKSHFIWVPDTPTQVLILALRVDPAQQPVMDVCHQHAMYQLVYSCSWEDTLGLLKIVSAHRSVGGLPVSVVGSPSYTWAETGETRNSFCTPTALCAPYSSVGRAKCQHGIRRRNLSSLKSQGCWKQTRLLLFPSPNPAQVASQQTELPSTAVQVALLSMEVG